MEGLEESEESDGFDDTDLASPTISCIDDHGISRVCTLIVRETIDVSKLEACIELSSRKTSSDFNAYLGHIGVDLPQLLLSESYLHIRRLYGDLHMQIDHGTCEMDLGRPGSQNLPEPDLTTCGRLCPCLALVLESTALPKRSCNYPEAGEWVAVQTDSKNGAVRVRIFRGHFSLLYYLADPLKCMPSTWLSCFDGCIRCLAYRFAFKNNSEARELLIEIHTITEKECTLWSAKMTGRLPENRLDAHHDDTGEGDSTGRSQFHALPARSAGEDGRRRSC